MKKISAFIICFLAATNLFAQDCSQYVYLQKGKTIEMTTFNRSGQVMAKIVNFVSDVSTANGTTTATVSTESFDKNGHSEGKTNALYKCTGGAFLIDINANRPQTSGGKFSSTYMEYPANMHVGEHFDDVTTQLQMTMNGRTINMTTKITNRTVADKESVTTPAGTWDAFKITYTTTITTDPTGVGPRTTETTQWYVPNFGIVQFLAFGMTIKLTSLH